MSAAAALGGCPDGCGAAKEAHCWNRSDWAATEERPILFSAPMVKAILAGEKTMTRRVCKPQPTIVDAGKPFRPQRYAREPYIIGGPFGRTPHTPIRCPYGTPAGHLWVRETFAPRYFDDGRPAFRADWTGESADVVKEPKWKPAIHMPRKFSRIDLEVTAVRVERLQDITEEDAKAEGVTIEHGTMRPLAWLRRSPDDRHVHAFARLWDEINGDKAPWKSNPWVWVVSFKRVRS